MKRWLPIIVVVFVGAGALLYSELTQDNTTAGSRSFLNWLAQTQRQAARVPMKVTRLSDEQEIRIGTELANQYDSRLKSDWNPSTDAVIEQYLNEVGARLVGGTTNAPAIVGLRTRRKLAYRFHYVPQRSMVNAFALPGGHIFVGEGILALLTSEDQLAAVLGHEIQHVDLYHSGERVQVEYRTRNVPLGGLLVLPIEIFQAGYGKDQELQADREGTILAVNAGYSAQGAVAVFETFQRLYQKQQRLPKDPGAEMSRVAWQTLVEYFRSHPSPEERIRQIQEMMDSRKLPLRQERSLQTRVPPFSTR
jgi:beta-barrel assembly-enhancing protease